MVLTPPGAPVVDDTVVGDAVEPGLESGSRLPLVTGADHAHPDILVQFLGHRMITALADYIAKQRASMPVIQVIEGRRIACTESGHQLFV